MKNSIKYLAILLLAGGGIISALLLWPQDTDSVAEEQVFVSRRGPLTISVTESGTINHREKIILKSTLEGQSTILYLIQEGIRVKKNELLIELDASELEEKKQQQEIILLNAEATYIHARQNLEIVRNQSQSNISKAELELTFARADLRKYLEGDYPMELQKAEAEITIAREELSIAIDKLEWSKRLEGDGYINRSERQADELATKRSKLEVELAEKRFNLLREYSHPRQLQELESTIEQSKNALERSQRIADADALQAKATAKARESELKQQKNKLAKIERLIASCRITAPVSGEVLYATTASTNWRSNNEPLQEGQQVREGQDLIHLPTTRSMMAIIKVHESSLLKVKPALPVRITVDAVPGREFYGTVGKISPLPDAVSAWLNPDLKLYSTEIYLEESGGELRPGMTCQAQIIVKEYEDVVYVPVQAVTRVGDSTVVHVAHNGSIEKRVVQVGLDDNRMVHIAAGLAEGESVLLRPPLVSADAPMQRSIGVNGSANREVSGKRNKNTAAGNNRSRPDD
jgi:HlyD family secretion protein